MGGARRIQLGLVLAACAACAGSSPGDASDDGASATTSQPIIGGTASDASQDAVVLVVHEEPSSTRGEICTGTLLTPTLVLTARHCLANTDATVACTAQGTPVEGGKVYSNFDPADVFVFAGAVRPTTISTETDVQRGSAIIDDGSSTLCNHDLALLLLATPVPDAKIAPVRLEGGAKVDEPVTLVGWGVADPSSRIPTTRQQRAQRVLAVGPSNDEQLGPSELLVGEGPCEGDSGGPALSASGAVIGLLSRGGLGQMSGYEACVDTTSVFTAASGFEDLIVKAYARAGQAPWFEGRQNPTAPEFAAPEPSDDGGGCRAAGRRGDPSAPAALALAASGLLARRRRTSRSTS